MNIQFEIKDESFAVGLGFIALLIVIAVMLTTTIAAYHSYVQYLDHQSKPAPAVKAVEKAAEVPK